MGKKSRNIGAALEVKLNFVHHRYRNMGRDVTRTPHPVKRLPYKVPGLRRGHYIACDEARTGADYAATVAGWSVRFDAKATQATRFALKRVQPHLAGHLDRCEENGGHAALLIAFNQDAWWTPWSSLKPLYDRWSSGDFQRGQASLTAQDVSSLGVLVSNRWGAVDWWPIVENLLELKRDIAAAEMRTRACSEE